MKKKEKNIPDEIFYKGGYIDEIFYKKFTPGGYGILDFAFIKGLEKIQKN